MCGAICGGVISMSKMIYHIRKDGGWGHMMAFVLPDKHYERWAKYHKVGNKKMAKKIFDRYAISQI